MQLDLVDVTHRYGNAANLFVNFSISFPPDSATALMGPSGSGKSTLLSIVGQLFPPRSGYLVIDGVPQTPGTTSPLLKSQIGWIFQQSNLLPRHTALFNVAMGPMSVGRSFDDSKLLALDALASVGLRSFADTPCRLLSGGEAQRVGVARTLASDPVIVLADEPTGQLDASIGGQIIDLLLDRNRDSRLSIIATHDAAVAARCERTVVLSKNTMSTL